MTRSERLTNETPVMREQYVFTARSNVANAQAQSRRRNYTKRFVDEAR